MSKPNQVAVIFNKETKPFFNRRHNTNIEVVNVKGRVVSDNLKSCYAEIVGYNPIEPTGYRGKLPDTNDIFVCEVVRQKGNVCVIRPIKKVSWKIIEVGEPIEGIKEKSLRCVEFPEMDYKEFVRRIDFGDTQAKLVELNEKFKEVSDNKHERERLFKDDFTYASKEKIQRFFEVYGEPETISFAGSDERTAILYYPCGSKWFNSKAEVLFDFLEKEPVAGWLAPKKNSDTNGWTAIYLPFALKKYPNIVLNHEVASVRNSTPQATEYFLLLPKDEREKIGEYLRTFISSPEKAAEKIWEESATFRDQYETAYREIGQLSAPGMAWFEYKNTTVDIDVTDDDGYGFNRRSSRSITHKCFDAYIHTGCLYTKEGKMSQGYSYRLGTYYTKIYTDDKLEETRSDIIKNKEEDIKRSLESIFKKITYPNNAEIIGMSIEEWKQRLDNRLNTLINEMKEKTSTEREKIIAEATEKFKESEWRFGPKKAEKADPKKHQEAEKDQSKELDLRGLFGGNAKIRR